MRPEQRKMIEDALAELRLEHVPKLLAIGDAIVALHAARGEPAEIRREAHRLHGSAGSFGLEEVGEIAARIEHAIDRGERFDDGIRALEAAIAAARAQGSGSSKEKVEP